MNKFLGILTLSSGSFAYIWVFYFTPIEINQGIVQKIMYLHVPSILAAYLALFVLFICSVGYLLTAKKYYDYINKASAEQAILYLAISLITGAIWGKPTWNTYWSWDARLTITLITFILFSAYVLYRFLDQTNIKQARNASILAIFSFFAVPLNHLSVNWFNTLHQKTTIFRAEPLIDKELYHPLLACVGFFLFLYLFLLSLRIKAIRYYQKYLDKIFS